METFAIIFLNKTVFYISFHENTKAAVQRCAWEKVLWKSVANLQENTHAKVRFQ